LSFVTEIPAPLTRSPLPAAGHAELFQIFFDAFELFLDGQSTPFKIRPKMVEEFPKDREGHFDTDFSIVLAGIRSSVMAVGNLLGPKVRESVPHPTKAGYRLVTYGWFEDVEMSFDVMAKSNPAANELVSLFHSKFMIPYTGIFKYFEARGIKNVTLLRRGADMINKEDYGEEISVRPFAGRLPSQEHGFRART